MIKPVLGVRVAPQVKEMLQKLADADNRSVASYLENMIIKMYQSQNNK